MVPLALVQFKVSGEPAVRFGMVLFNDTTTVVVLVQPFEPSVTVTVYVPGALTEGLEVFPPEVIPGPAQA